tara:strand:+ start:9278 stop:10882 length:1605 start_codon:yes stop_codon:yes gene_type:complete
MSYFNINDNNISTEEKITYIYSGVSINRRDIITLTNDDNKNSIKKTDLPDVDGKRIPVKNTFYQIKLRNKEPNFIYGGLSPSSYTAKSIYLFGLLHRNISGISSNDKSNIIGEIVIEHTNPNKQLQKVYTCFLIKETKETDVTELPDGQPEEDIPNKSITNKSIDGLIPLINNKLAPEYTFDLSSDIPTQTHSIHYVDKTNHIFVFTNPIEINKDTAKFFKNEVSHKTNLFSIYPTNDSSNKTLFYGSETILLNGTPSNTDGFRLMEGIDGDDNAAESNDIWIDCSPTGESDDTVAGIRNVTIDGEYSDHKEQIDGFKMLTHFFMFILITLLSFFMIPKLYKNIIVDFFNKTPAPPSPPHDATAVHTNIFHADMAMIMIFLFNVGVSFVSISIYYIMFMFAIAIASFAIIQFNKTQSAFMTTDGNNSSYASNATFQPKDASIFGGGLIIAAMGAALWNKKLPNSDYRLFIPYLLFAILSFIIIKSVMYGIEYQLEEDDNKKEEVKFFNIWWKWLKPLAISFTVISPIIILVINS